MSNVRSGQLTKMTGTRNVDGFIKRLTDKSSRVQRNVERDDPELCKGGKNRQNGSTSLILCQRIHNIIEKICFTWPRAIALAVLRRAAQRRVNFDRGREQPLARGRSM